MSIHDCTQRVDRSNEGVPRRCRAVSRTANARHVGMSSAHPKRHKHAANVALAEGKTLSSVLCLAAKSCSPSRDENQNVSAPSSKNWSSAVAINARASRRHVLSRVAWWSSSMASTVKA